MQESQVYGKNEYKVAVRKSSRDPWRKKSEELEKTQACTRIYKILFEWPSSLNK